MKRQSLLASLLLVGLLVVACDTVVYTPDTRGPNQFGTTGAPMSPTEARQQLEESLTHLYGGSAANMPKPLVKRNGFFNCRFATMSPPYVVHSGMMNWYEVSSSPRGLSGANIDGITKGTEYCLVFQNEADAQQVTRALQTLITDAKNAKARGITDTAEFEAFKGKAKAWRELPNKPALNEQAERYRVLAENAYKEKSFDKTVEYYEAALKAEPCWPSGHFNCATIDGELGNFEDAAFHMKCYLELAPNAPDAKTARENMYVWEEKAQK